MNKISLPEEFVAQHCEELCCALDGTAEVSIRLNPAKYSDSTLTDTVKWCEDGRYLSDRPQFTLDPLHAAGSYYVQEASSMAVGEIVRRVLKQEELSDIIAVDLCAAPGGKSTHISTVVGSRGVVVANEVIRNRAGILSQNVVRWGEGNTVVTSGDSSVISSALQGRVDILVVDAPCSGEGMFRKDEGARAEWSEENVELCAARQRRIIADATPMLRSGAILIYSTCTFNTKENDENVEWMVDSGEFEIVRSLTADLGDGGALGSHFYPHESRGEGLFVAALRYTGDNKARKIKDKKTKRKISEFSSLPLEEVEFAGKLYGYSPLMGEVVELLQSGRVHILMAGIEFGEMIRGSLKPSHNYALYSYASDSFPKCEVSLEVALDFLRKAPLSADNFIDGLQRVTYRGLTLGFAKRIGGRVNNMYPTAWRIVNL